MRLTGKGEQVRVTRSLRQGGSALGREGERRWLQVSRRTLVPGEDPFPGGERAGWPGRTGVSFCSLVCSPLQETFSKWPFLLTAVDGLGVGDAVLASGWVWDRSPSCLL